MSFSMSTLQTWTIYNKYNLCWRWHSNETLFSCLVQVCLLPLLHIQRTLNLFLRKKIAQSIHHFTFSCNKQIWLMNIPQMGKLLAPIVPSWSIII
jgi:hypothetical protein